MAGFAWDGLSRAVQWNCNNHIALYSPFEPKASRAQNDQYQGQEGGSPNPKQLQFHLGLLPSLCGHCYRALLAIYACPLQLVEFEELREGAGQSRQGHLILGLHWKR